MSEPPKKSDPGPGLNPGLRRRTEDVYDTRHRTPPPAESASVQHDEGRAWPMVWLIVMLVGVAIGIWLIFL